MSFLLADDIFGEWLLKDTVLPTESESLVSFLGGDYVYWPNLYPGFDNTHKAITFRRNQGSPNISGSEISVSAFVRCFGGADGDWPPGAVYERLEKRVHNQTGDTSSGHLAKAAIQNAFPEELDRKFGYPVIIALVRYTVIL